MSLIDRFLEWLAVSPLASAVKVAVAAMLAYFVGNPSSLDLPPWAMVAITAAVPVIVNWLNPADGRYGRGR